MTGFIQVEPDRDYKMVFDGTVKGVSRRTRKEVECQVYYPFKTLNVIYNRLFGWKACSLNFRKVWPTAMFQPRFPQFGGNRQAKCYPVSLVPL